MFNNITIAFMVAASETSLEDVNKLLQLNTKKLGWVYMTKVPLRSRTIYFFYRFKAQE